MFRFLFRLIGLILVAAGFVAFVVDGTRAIANGAIAFTSLGEALGAAAPRAAAALEAGARKIHPALWDPVLLNGLFLPASISAFLLGVAFLWLGRKPVEPIGYLARR